MGTRPVRLWCGGHRAPTLVPQERPVADRGAGAGARLACGPTEVIGRVGLEALQREHARRPARPPPAARSLGAGPKVPARGHCVPDNGPVALGGHRAAASGAGRCPPWRCQLPPGSAGGHGVSPPGMLKTSAPPRPGHLGSGPPAGTHTWPPCARPMRCSGPRWAGTPSVARGMSLRGELQAIAQHLVLGRRRPGAPSVP